MCSSTIYFFLFAKHFKAIFTAPEAKRKRTASTTSSQQKSKKKDGDFTAPIEVASDDELEDEYEYDEEIEEDEV